MARGTGCFASDALHSATVSEEAVRIVVEEVVAWLVEDSSAMCLCDCHAHSIAETLAQWARGDFHTFGIVALRMTRCDTVDTLEELYQPIRALFLGGRTNKPEMLSGHPL